MALDIAQVLRSMALDIAQVLRSVELVAELAVAPKPCIDSELGSSKLSDISLSLSLLASQRVMRTMTGP